MAKEDVLGFVVNNLDNRNQHVRKHIKNQNNEARRWSFWLLQRLAEYGLFLKSNGMFSN
jgi:hypothetical protein